jgi:predicted nucleic acid-binding protein
MNNLVDSSVWIEYFKGNQKYSFITDLISTNTICTNDIILTELLPSIIYRKEHKLAELLNCIKSMCYLLTGRKYAIYSFLIYNMEIIT